MTRASFKKFPEPKLGKLYRLNSASQEQERTVMWVEPVRDPTEKLKFNGRLGRTGNGRYITRDDVFLLASSTERPDEHGFITYNILLDENLYAIWSAAGGDHRHLEVLDPQEETGRRLLGENESFWLCFEEVKQDGEDGQ